MLDIGFRDDIRLILGKVDGPHQTVFVSATLSDEIKRLANQYTKDPVEVNVSRDEITVDEVTQVFVGVEPWDKFRALRMILDREQPKLVIIFCNTKRGVTKLAKRLHGEGIDAREIHGDLVQSKRERVMEKFRKHNLHVLVATDLASRGIDVHGITHIINYDVPMDTEAYVHRIGRTARMGSFGKAISLVTREQGKLLTEIEKLINLQITEERIEGFEPSPPPRGESGGYAPSPAGGRPMRGGHSSSPPRRRAVARCRTRFGPACFAARTPENARSQVQEPPSPSSLNYDQTHVAPILEKPSSAGYRDLLVQSGAVLPLRLYGRRE